MKRQLALLDYALGRLWRRRWQNLVLAVALALVVAVAASILFIADALRGEFRSAAAVMPDLTVQRLVAGRPALIDEGQAAAIERIAAVRRVQRRVWGYYFMPALAGNLTVVGVEAGAQQLRDLRLVVDGPGMATRGAGEPRDAGPHVGQMILGEALACYLGLQIGDEIALPAGGQLHRFEMRGTFRSDSALWSADVLLTDVDSARALLGVPAGQATDLAVVLTTPDEATVVAGKLAALMPDARVIDRRLLRRAYDLTYDARGGTLLALLLPSLLALLLLGWERLSGLAPAERREIAIVKAVGWETSDVLAVRMWESAVIATVGATAGIVAAYLFVFHLHAPGLSAALFGWSSIYPPLRLTPQLDASQVLALLATVVLPFVAVSAVPAWRAASLDPDDALRGST